MGESVVSFYGSPSQGSKVESIGQAQSYAWISCSTLNKKVADIFSHRAKSVRQRFLADFLLFYVCMWYLFLAS
jgi:hypothetical protein